MPNRFLVVALPALALVAACGPTRQDVADGRMAGGENAADLNTAKQGNATLSTSTADGSRPAGDAAPADGGTSAPMATPDTGRRVAPNDPMANPGIPGADLNTGPGNSNTGPGNDGTPIRRPG